MIVSLPIPQNQTQFMSPPPLNDIVGEFDFRKDVPSFQARKVADIPHWKRKIVYISGILPHFLKSPTIS